MRGGVGWGEEALALSDQGQEAGEGGSQQAGRSCCCSGRALQQAVQSWVTTTDGGGGADCRSCDQDLCHTDTMQQVSPMNKVPLGCSISLHQPSAKQKRYI